MVQMDVYIVKYIIISRHSDTPPVVHLKARHYKAGQGNLGEAVANANKRYLKYLLKCNLLLLSCLRSTQERDLLSKVSGTIQFDCRDEFLRPK